MSSNTNKSIPPIGSRAWNRSQNQPCRLHPTAAVPHTNAQCLAQKAVAQIGRRTQTTPASRASYENVVTPKLDRETVDPQIFSFPIAVPAASDSAPHIRSTALRSQDMPPILAISALHSHVEFESIHAEVLLAGTQTTTGVFRMKFALDNTVPPTAAQLEIDADFARPAVTSGTFVERVPLPGGMNANVDPNRRAAQPFPRIDVVSTSTTAVTLTLRIRLRLGPALQRINASQALPGAPAVLPATISFPAFPGAQDILESTSHPGVFRVIIAASATVSTQTGGPSWSTASGHRLVTGPTAALNSPTLRQLFRVTHQHSSTLTLTFA